MKNFIKNNRYIIYMALFAAVGVFDAVTTMGSWVIELSTGLVDQGGGFPDDYIVAMFFLGLFLLTLYSASNARNGIISRGREIFLAVMAIIGTAFIGLVIAVIAVWSNWGM